MREHRKRDTNTLVLNMYIEYRYTLFTQLSHHYNVLNYVHENDSIMQLDENFGYTLRLAKSISGHMSLLSLVHIVIKERWNVVIPSDTIVY